MLQQSSKRPLVFGGVSLIVLAIALFSFMAPVQALVSDFVDFNDESDLTDLFSDDGSPQFTNSATGGLNNTGAINVPSGSSDVWTTKQGYSVSGAGDVYRFSAFFRVSANSGRGGLGFTASSNNTANLYATPLTGLGVTFHGGGGEFINNQTATVLSWPPDLVISPPTWYYMVLEVSAKGSNTYDMNFQIWNTDGAGELTTMKTEKTLDGVVNNDVGGASIIHGYFSADGQRMDKIDNFQIELEGGAGFIEAGNPVVLTGSPADITGTSAVIPGDVTSDQGAEVTARGVCYATTNSPDLGDTCATNGTGTGSYSVSISGLSGSTTYYARAYAMNSEGTTYGSERSFTTLEGPADDNDGISTAIEDAAPNDGDANEDGTLDSEQANVASYVNPVTGTYSALEVDEECSITSVESLSELEVSSIEDVGYTYPAGLMDFTIDCGSSGFTATISQHYYGLEDDILHLRKYTPASGYFTVTEETTLSTELTSVTYQVTDGGELDIDGEENGVIQDPAGLALAESSSDSSKNSSNDSLAETGQNSIMALFMSTTLIVVPLAISRLQERSSV